MALPLKYNIRNVLVRWRTTLFTVLGIGAVVLVFLGLRALGRGIEATNANTGDPRNLLVVRKVPKLSRGPWSPGTSSGPCGTCRASPATRPGSPWSRPSW